MSKPAIFILFIFPFDVEVEVIEDATDVVEELFAELFAVFVVLFVLPDSVVNPCRNEVVVKFEFDTSPLLFEIITYR